VAIPAINSAALAANDKGALIIAHPGHELCVYGWLETARPKVFVLTDGTGRSGVPRLDSTTKILTNAGATPHGSLYGRFTDLEIYNALLQGDYDLFVRLAQELAEALVVEEFTYVVGDATEGYNPTHDVCRLLIDTAVEIASRIRGRTIVNRDFLLFRRHNTHPEALRASAIWLTLDDELLERKLTLARTYPELQGEVDAVLDQKTLAALRAFPELSEHVDKFVTSSMGSEAYRVECLRLVNGRALSSEVPNEVPFYERYGEMLVAAGTYQRAIRYREHFLPLVEAVRNHVHSEISGSSARAASPF